MTREKLFDRFDEIAITLNEKEYHEIKYLFSLFLDSNICIPKGKNRHRCADVLHEAIEDTTKKLEVMYSMDGWSDSKLMLSNMYRIKPSEPVYEYLWMDLRTPDTYGCPTNKYMTVDEASMYFNQSRACFRVKQTKRIRV
jgi:hypothetical protein